MKHFKFIITVFLFTTFSCETVIDVEIPNSEPKLVINSYINSDRFFPGPGGFIHVSNSTSGVGIITNIDSSLYEGISNANVEIYELNNTNDSVVELFPLSFNNECKCYIDLENNFTPKENTKYELKVAAEGFNTINAIEKTPQKPDYTIENFQLITKLDSRKVGELCNFNISLQDPPNENNYYRLSVVLEDVTSGKYVSCDYEIQDPSFLIPINKSSSSDSYYNGKNGYFTDHIFNGEERSIYVSVEKPNKKKYTSIRLSIQAYSENLYNFNLTRKEQNRESNNVLFNSEPVFIDSNINEGYGIFGGKTIKEYIYIGGEWYEN